MRTSFWVIWDCEGNEFEAYYPTADERDVRAGQLRAEEVAGIAEGTTESYATNIRTREIKDEDLQPTNWITELAPERHAVLVKLLHGPVGEGVRRYTENEDFAIWMLAIDCHLRRELGISVFDLADQCYRDQFDDGVPPSEVSNGLIAGVQRNGLFD